MSTSTANPNRVRVCPRCETSLSPEEHRADHGVTWLWRCGCGWSGAMTESGVTDRREVLDAVRRTVGSNPPGPTTAQETDDTKG